MGIEMRHHRFAPFNEEVLLNKSTTFLTCHTEKDDDQELHLTTSQRWSNWHEISSIHKTECRAFANNTHTFMQKAPRPTIRI